MSKIFGVIIILAVGVLYSSCATIKKQPAENETTEETSEKKVCCESYGYGSEMKKCCEKYEMTTKEECKVKEDFVGGGKNIVDNSFCQK